MWNIIRSLTVEFTNWETKTFEWKMFDSSFEIKMEEIVKMVNWKWILWKRVRLDILTDTEITIEGE